MSSEISKDHKIVLIYGDHGAISLIPIMLARKFENIEVLIARSVPDGLDLVANTRPELILLGWWLLEGIGWGLRVLECLKEDPDLRDIPVVMLSTDSSPDTVAHCMGLGVVDFVSLPLTVQTLAQSVNKVLKASGKLPSYQTKQLENLPTGVHDNANIANAPTERKNPGMLRTQGSSSRSREAWDVPDVLSVLPPPFGWCSVPCGTVIHEIAGAFAVHSFWIAKYPVTYAQHKVFMDSEDGFHNSRWWEGLEAGAEHKENPGKQHWKGKTRPCDGVSWWDAIAFCQWLNARLGLPLIPTNLEDTNLSSYGGIRLPNEWEWQWAAQGPDRRDYPWGNEFDPTICNLRPKPDWEHSAPTTAVGRYRKGASPYGVMDMVGNVWEWCLNTYPPSSISLGGKEWRVLRGGSWGSRRGSTACVADRISLSPDFRDQTGLDGFRICISSSPP